MTQANGLLPRGSLVCELLGAYQEVLDTVRDLPLVPMVLWRHGDRSGLGRLHYLPRPRWMLRYFVVRHIDRTLASLGRRYNARAALGSASDSEQLDREAVQVFQQSLPPTRPKTYLTLLIVATIVLGRPIVEGITSYALNLMQLDEKRNLLGSPDLSREVRDTVEKLGAALSPDFTSVNGALSALLNGGLKQVILVTVGLTLSLYVVLRPFVPAFRLKRMLFNLAPEPQGRRRSATARWSVSQTAGIYERERTLFEKLGGRPPKEFPFDLVVPALAMLAPLALGVLFIRLGPVDPIIEYRATDLGFGAWLMILALFRLGWLNQAWQRRESCRRRMYMPFEVRIRGGRAVAKVEAPLLVGTRALVILLFFLFFAIQDRDPHGTLLVTILVIFAGASSWALIVSLPWWYRINRELRDLDQSYGMRRFGRSPTLSLLMMTVGWIVLLPPFISIFICVRCIERAQTRTGHPENLRSPLMLAPGLLVFPVLFAYLQREVNKIWSIEGEPLDTPPPGVSMQTQVAGGTNEPV